ncbi:indolepyruvate ferredoxin oxidoreductase family protein [Gemmobacter sp.]|uniref:indolepyruvate ferredoxin oxidoreductase family protein n=1 Tax=Gemmobacter sp. TaxID=1898957 RepID=UPI002AFFE128|nr:indolepyruvate ferredoxin oxidoreductase family protein [Gemmobacter sp.]
MNAPAKPPALTDRYSQPSGRILVSGAQALIRLLIEQHARDRADGLNTAGFVSGYRGSPLADFDGELNRARKFLETDAIRFQPGLNEDLAATAVWGSQQTDLSPGARHDGVFAMWYGKGPGVDRSMDAIRHANAAGTHPKGGVLLLMGDDHGAVSSTFPHQSEHVLISAMVPVLAPAGVEEYIDFGLMGFALSRFAGVWVGFKCQTEIVECTASLTLPDPAARPVLPAFDMPPGGLHIRWPDDKLAQERRLETKLAAVRAFAAANGLDRILGAGAGARRGIVATGKAWRDLMGAFDRAGITPEDAGIRLLKVGLVWPMVPETLDRFADGLDEILVIEEKRPVIEDQIRAQFYNRTGVRPRLWGKTTPDGAPLISSTSELDPAGLVPVLAAFLRRTITTALPEAPAPTPNLPFRVPYFCSGCPHSVSTRLPDGSRATAGIGCSMLAVDMDRNVETFTQMGGEGANWIGHAPFTDEKHVFVHMGDGTYFHSGLLAIRAAVAAGVNATYKILFNDAVAMTGGQKHDGDLTVPAAVDQIRAEGVRELVVIAEQPEVWQGRLPTGVKVLHRDHLLAEQTRLRDVEGVTCIIYDQVCAAEKRRRRKRGSYPKPAAHVMINPEVCEGCGDCSVQSNCIAIEPLETDLGRKRQVNLSACNADLSCLKGFCPSFVTIQGGKRRRSLAPLPAAMQDALPDPVPAPITGSHALLLAGIGGTGVITVSAILAQAAHLDGLAVQVLNQTGLAQKNGAVMSHLRVATDPRALHAPRIGRAEADAVLGFDSVVAASPKGLATIDPARTRVVVDRHVTPTAGFVRNPTGDLQSALPMGQLRRRAGDNLVAIDATDLALRHFGDAIAANILLTGHAFQSGLIPISAGAITMAITLNGGGVDQNLAAFHAGRLLAANPGAFAPTPATAEPSVADLRAMFIARLTAWQNAAYAARFATLVDRAAAQVQGWDGADDFLRALMRGAHHVMAWKDEYEVARLHADPAFAARIAAEFEGDYTLHYHLAPPILSRTDPRTGRPAKRRFGPWMQQGFRLLARLKPLRGTPFDPFGHTHERRAERALRDDYLRRMDSLLATLAPDTLPAATAKAASVLEVRGFGPVKAANLARWRASHP